ncbi:hypothetical protein [Rhizobacter sp. Root1221]|uniref:hypothetical protein n=1 Tax=Rhizobacter sp. Root1221 TaxID=1736433 RepID=UPI000B108352|nr:hypothetical protein [Rhizobacter sp. Root1221]
MFRLPLLTAAALSALLLSGCDLLGDSPEKIAAAREADGRAIGGACRHAGRAIEDCYALNKKADKAAVFAGWRDMNDYMRENKIDTVAPQVTPPVASGRKAERSSESAKADGGAVSASESAETVVQVERKPAKATVKQDGDH